jgi:hypothetical protein
METHSKELDSSHPVIIIPCDDGVVAHVVAYPGKWVGTIMTYNQILQVFTLDAARAVVSYYRGHLERHHLDYKDIAFTQLKLSIDSSGQIKREWKPCENDLPREMEEPSEQVVKWMSIQEVLKI